MNVHLIDKKTDKKIHETRMEVKFVEGDLIKFKNWIYKVDCVIFCYGESLNYLEVYLTD